MTYSMDAEKMEIDPETEELNGELIPEGFECFTAHPTEGYDIGKNGLLHMDTRNSFRDFTAFEDFTNDFDDGSERI